MSAGGRLQKQYIPPRYRMQFHTDDDLDDIKDDHHHSPDDEDGINDDVRVGSCLDRVPLWLYFTDWVGEQD